MVFFAAMVIVFSFLYRIAGIVVSDNNYDGVNEYVFYTIQILRNSIGDE